ncbi:hypothetical protein GA0116948_1013 [Chitinophaga costaii]|uniref:Uncharacterized protein n=1 Tax=Chitinophaga costaii TaxID=1335309 RepID=A0A1C3YNV8_9BACT|nr:hypothetical protein [Chitinophaga costaii]PUZ30018.1 hypothetical protein DCM91_00620 [Chitinophaga costaii]SCB71732.1 hypothetical protein GA0116948_1013 [Chitinophaga costaii]
MNQEAKTDLLDALAFYQITIVEDNGQAVSVQNNYTIVIESNGLYKLKEEDLVIAPFNDLNALCRFILT